MSERVSNSHTAVCLALIIPPLSLREEAVTVVEHVEVEEEVEADQTQTAAVQQKRNRVKPSWISDVSWIRRSGPSSRAVGRLLVC